MIKIQYKVIKKTNANSLNELTDYQKQLREFIIEIQSLYKSGHSKSQIVKMLKTTYKRIRKYLVGDPDILCRSDGRNTYSRPSLIDPYKERINQLLSEGKNYKETYKQIQSEGYSGKYTILCDYCSSLDKYISPKAKSQIMIPKQYINRSDVFKYLWSDEKEKISDETYERLIIKYPKIKEIQVCISDFKTVFTDKDVTLLYKFIEKYKNSKIKSIAGFAGGLAKDKTAVENSITSIYSNAFVEGNNNRLKLIKRQMYGRAKLPLLKAKVIIRNDIFLSTVNQN